MILLLVLTAALVFSGIGGLARRRSARDRQRLEVQLAWRGVEAALAQRHEAVTELTAACRRGKLADEEYLSAVASALASASRPGGLPSVRSVVETVLDRSLVPVLCSLAGAQPHIVELRDDLARANCQLAVTRKRYNCAAQRANELDDRLPGRLLTPTTRAERFEYFDLADPACGPEAAVIYEC